MRPDPLAAHASNMSDLIYVGVVLVFFAVSAAYVRLCEQL